MLVPKLDVLGGNGGESICAGLALSSLLCGWVNAISNQRSSLVALLTRTFQRHIGIRAERQQLFLAEDAVLESPQPRATRRDEEKHSSLVVAFVRLRRG